ncbi:MAG TPA: hypothetical protein DEA08_37785 [Planctomycetes bacterium]|nr:hypothetical protein [Planctomycetota bacterium]
MPWFRRSPPALDLSVTVAVWNRARELEGLLENVEGFAKEVVVVDGGSDDDTAEVCRNHPLARRIEHPWEGHFARIKNASLAAAQGEWILHLDSDERVSPGLAEQLPWLCARRVPFYRLPMLWLVEEDPPRFVKSAKHYPCYVPRLLRNLPQHRYRDDVGPVHPTFPKAVRKQMKKVRDPRACLLHYCLAWLSRSALTEKARDYAAREPGSEETNAAYYLWWQGEHELVDLEDLA